MAKSLSQDLRCRLIWAVAGGLSRRGAAERFGVSAASAVRWVRSWRETGRRAAKRQGGDRRSERIEVYGSVILGAIEAKVDLTLSEIAEMLRVEHGTSFAPSTVWRFLDRHAMTLKKNSARSRAGQARRRRRPRLGVNLRRVSIPTSWYSSTRLVVLIANQNRAY
jgi:transposase